MTGQLPDPGVHPGALPPPTGAAAQGGETSGGSTPGTLAPGGTAQDAAGRPQRRGAVRAQLMSLGPIIAFDVVGPLVLYSVLRGQGFSQVASLAISGVFPVFGVILNAVRFRRLDAVGVLVLLGIVVGVTVALITGSARLLLLEDSIPTGVFGLACLGSLWTSRPLMYRFAIESMGPDSPRGRAFAANWQYEGFRRVFVVITIGWGVAYLAEAAARVIIVESYPIGTALLISKVMPYAVAAVLVAWNIEYGRRARRRGEAARARAEAQAAGAQATGPQGAGAQATGAQGAGGQPAHD